MVKRNLNDKLKVNKAEILDFPVVSTRECVHLVTQENLTARCVIEADF